MLIHKLIHNQLPPHPTLPSRPRSAWASRTAPHPTTAAVLLQCNVHTTHYYYDSWYCSVDRSNPPPQPGQLCTPQLTTTTTSAAVATAAVCVACSASHYESHSVANLPLRGPSPSPRPRSFQLVDPWSYLDDDPNFVAQIQRQGCHILSRFQRPCTDTKLLNVNRLGGNRGNCRRAMIMASKVVPPCRLLHPAERYDGGGHRDPIVN